MQSGYNTNIRHRGVLFHVQTEDGGSGHPRVVTHLFCGGTALATERGDYSAELDAPDPGARVRHRMQAQHRAMLERLRRGEFDAVIEERLDPGPSGNATCPGVPRPSEPAGIEAPIPTGWPGGSEAAPRPLHELVLDYLVERASRRPRPAR